MKLYLVVFQDELECTGYNLIEELVIADNEVDATEKAWEKYYNSKGFAIKPKREDHYVDHISELDEVDGYELIVGNKINNNKGEGINL